MKYLNDTFITLTLLLLVSFQAQSAPFTLDENIKVHELKFEPLKKHPKMLWAGANATLGSESHYITINDMTPQRQEKAILISVNHNQLQMDIVKDTWTDVAKTCSTSEDNSCEVDFRNFGDASFKITGAPGSRYKFILLAGPEHPIAETLSKPVYAVSKDQLNKMSPLTNSDTDNNNSNFQTIVIVLLVFLIIAVLIVAFSMLKRKNTLNGFLLLLLLPSLLLTQNMNVFAADDGNKPLPPPGSFTGMKAAEMQGLEDAAGRSKQNLNTTNSITNSAIAGAQQINRGIQTLESSRTLAKAWLTDCSSSTIEPDAPRIPSFCAGSESCQSCYSEANIDFNKARATLEKLRHIYSCSQNFSKAAISFGDSASGIHAVVGLAWQSQKMDILQSVKGLKKAYDQKYPELMNRLHTAMMKQNQCEANFGVPDWYDRFGHMYYEFIADKYKRSN